MISQAICFKLHHGNPRDRPTGFYAFDSFKRKQFMAESVKLLVETRKQNKEVWELPTRPVGSNGGIRDT